MESRGRADLEVCCFHALWCADRDGEGTCFEVEIAQRYGPAGTVRVDSFSHAIPSIIAHIRMLNDARENALFHLRLTFTPGLTQDNHTRAMQGRSGR